MAKLFLSVRVPEKSYSVLTLDNIDLAQSVCYLKDEIARKINFPKEKIELVYCGNVMEDNENIRALDVRPLTLIHVFQKTAIPKPYVSVKTCSDEECQRIADIFGTVTGTQINVATRIRILQRILMEYPEFRKNLGAQALIRDSILFHTLNKVEVIKKVAQNYPVICDAAEFIVKITKKEIAKNERMNGGTGGDETFSDNTSSSEEENSSSTSQAEQERIRRISRDQLSAALMLAGSASLNSLSNIAQRNASRAEEQQRSQQQPPQNPSSSSSASSSARISSSRFSNALSQALLSAGASSRTDGEQTQSMDISEPQPEDATPPAAAETPSNQPTRFLNEIQIMREMGLTDENLNLQALMLSNGDVQAAVNLVLGGMNSLFN